MAIVSAMKANFFPEFSGILHDEVLPAMFGGRPSDYAVKADSNEVTVATSRATVNALTEVLNNFLGLVPDVVDATIAVGDAQSVVTVNCPTGGVDLMVEVRYMNQVWMEAQSVAAVNGDVTVILSGDNLEEDGIYTIWFYEPANKSVCGMTRITTEDYIA